MDYTLKHLESVYGVSFRHCCSGSQLQWDCLVSNPAGYSCCNTLRSGTHCKCHGLCYKSTMCILLSRDLNQQKG